MDKLPISMKDKSGETHYLGIAEVTPINELVMMKFDSLCDTSAWEKELDNAAEGLSPLMIVHLKIGDDDPFKGVVTYMNQQNGIVRVARWGIGSLVMGGPVPAYKARVQPEG